jgi:DNA-binding transcriptional regulator YhcF (GntR family)
VAILENFSPNDAGEPPYRQVRRAIAAGIASGEIAVGERLPSVRALAAQLGLAANTAAKVYKELEEAGLVETRGRNGTVVTGRGAHVPAKVLGAVERLAQLAHEAGMEPEAVAGLVRAALAGR